MDTNLSFVIGQQSLIAILVYFACMIVTWWALQAIDLTKIMKKNKIMQIQLLYILFTIVIGSAVGNFLLMYLNHAQNLSGFFG